MKKLLIIFLLLISTCSFGQAVLSGSKGWDGFLTSGADSLITRMETAVGKTMTVAGKTMISDMFKMYKDSLSITSLQNFFDVLYFLDIGVETAAKLNWVKNAHNITNVNSVTFDTTGAYGDGSTSYLNTNYNPSTQALNYKLNTGSFGLYQKKDTAALQGDFGFYSVSYRLSLYSRGSNLLTIFMNSGAKSVVVSNAQGFSAGIRKDTLNIILLKDYDSIGYHDNLPTVALANSTLWICRINGLNNWNRGIYSFLYISKDMTLSEYRKIYNIQRYWANNKNSITFFNP